MVDNDLVLRIPHSLGAFEAKKRMAEGLVAAQAQYGQFVQMSKLDWEDNRLTFALSAVAQTIRGTIDVEETYVELRAQLPLVLRLLAKRFLPVVQDTGRKLLK